MRSSFLTLGLMLALLVPAASGADTLPAPVTVPGSNGAVTSRVAASRDGTIAVAWGGAKVAIRRADGHWEPSHRLVAANRTGAGVDLAFDTRNQLVVTWVQSPAAPGHAIRGPFTINAVTWTAGRKWGVVKVLGRSGHFLEANPRVTHDYAGDSLIYWQGLRRNASHQVRACVSTSFRAAGGLFGREQQIADGGPYQDVKLDDHGNAYAVWTQSTGNSTVNRFAYKRRGGSWGSPKTFSADPSSIPALAVTPGGGAVIGYRGAQADSEGNGTQLGAVYTVTRSPSGVFSTPVKLSDDRTHDVRAAVSPTGEVMLAWGASLYPNGPGDLRFSVRPPEGDASPEQAVPGAQIGPVDYTRHGDALLAYDDHQQVFMIERPHTAATFGAPSTLSTTGQYPALSILGTRAAISWMDTSRNRLKVLSLSL